MVRTVLLKKNTTNLKGNSGILLIFMIVAILNMGHANFALAGSSRCICRAWWSMSSLIKEDMMTYSRNRNCVFLFPTGESFCFLYHLQFMQLLWVWGCDSQIRRGSRLPISVTSTFPAPGAVAGKWKSYYHRNYNTFMYISAESRTFKFIWITLSHHLHHSSTVFQSQ